MEYKVDADVPVPEPLIPIGILNVGESIAFQLEKRPNVASMASRLKREVGKEFTIKKISDTEARIWRTK